MKIALLVIALASVVSCFTETQYRDQFTQWMQAHKKSYTANDFQHRFAIFKSNLDYATQWNNGNTKTKLGMTVMADLSNDEYRRIYLGTHITKTPGVFAPSKRNVNDPSSVDWNQQGAVTYIKNQGQCGDCWAFSTTGSVEGIHEIATGNLVSLSEQNLCDCSGSEGNNGCNGGVMDYAFQYIINNGGIDTESSYPYQGVQGQCQFNPSNVGATITGYSDVSSGDEGALESAVVQQPVSVAIDASHQSFQLYTSGVYYEPACSSSQLDHGVLAIGYGSDNGDNYWLVKNSWGTSWGQQGFIWMAKDQNNNCGIATSASYPTGGGGGSSTGSTSSTSSSSYNAAFEVPSGHKGTGESIKQLDKFIF